MRGRPMSAASAPKARVTNTSAPVRMPLSSRTTGSGPMRSRIPTRTSSEAIDRSTWRQPWLETMMPSMPESTARRASSGCRTPLSKTGSRVRSRRVSMWAHDRPGFEWMSRNASTAASGLGERRLSRVSPGCRRDWLSNVRAPLAAVISFSAPLVPASGEGSSDAAATRCRTISAKRGSDVYWATPMPWENGSDPRSRSWVRQPSIVVSMVTTSALAPAASARPIRESTRRSSPDQ